MSRPATNPILSGEREKPLSGKQKVVHHSTTPRKPRSGARKKAKTRRDSLPAGRGSQYWVSGYKHLVAEWHPTKNGILTPDEVSYGSGKRIWWKCGKGLDHEWQAPPGIRIGQGRGCPFCAHQKVSVTNCLATVAPHIAAEWHPKKNGKVTPRDVTAGAAKKYWWQCPQSHLHVYQASCSRRVYEGHGCSACECFTIARDNNLRALYPAVARQWHPTKNGDLRPKDIVPGSTKKAWWKCRKGSDHEWEALIRARTKMGHTCPFCANRRPSVTNRLDIGFPELAAEWHPSKNGTTAPADVVHSTKAFVWWRCSTNPRHVWRARVVDRTVRGVGCPKCRGR